MVTLRLHNTKSRVKEVFSPIDPNNVRMYVCGPTVYDRAHLGNGRPVVVFDVLYRLLRHVYGADHVTYVRNFTDVDDKINATAQARKAAGDPRTLEALIFEQTEKTIGWYHADMDALGALRPSFEPRATEYIPQMVEMIEGLIASGHAYEKAGHVLFRVRSYENYGALSGRSVDDMIAGARVEIAPFKEDPMDFVLWKPSDADLPGWESPWGKGRPGWHIECSAMAYELLGGSFDIHGGGLDLQFPHHENEIAQSACAHPEEGFANVWMHNEMLQVEGKKMSKSLGNFFTVRDLLDQGVPGEVVRMVYLGTHYSKPMDWTQDKAAQAEATLRKWRKLTEFVQPSEPSEAFMAALADDLNVSLALSRMDELAKKGERERLKACGEALGILGPEEGRWYWESLSMGDISKQKIPDWHPLVPHIESLVGGFVETIKQTFSANKINWVEVLGNMRSLGNLVQYIEQTYPSLFSAIGDYEYAALDPEVFEYLVRLKVSEAISDRNRAKQLKQFEVADSIRSALLGYGVDLIDQKDGCKWILTSGFSKIREIGDLQW